jgi:hypothetical protein
MLSRGRKTFRRQRQGIGTARLLRWITAVLLFLLLYVVNRVSYSNSSQPDYDLLGMHGSQKAEISKVSTALALEQSLGFFDDIPDEAWKKMRHRAQRTPRYRNATYPEDGYDSAGWWYSHNLQPNFSCFNMERVGGLDDGPKWTCDPHRLLQRDNCLIYSIGSAGQYQWEQGLIQRLESHCEIHVFDPGNYSRDDMPANIHYHQWGLKSSYDENYNPSLYKGINPVEMLTYQQNLRRLGHEDRVIDIFKLDCEKCEWSSYKDWIGGNIRQLIVEVHGVPSPKGPNEWHHAAHNVSDFFDEFEKQGFAMYFKEPNVYTRSACVEFGYIKLRPEFWEG